MKSKTFLKSEKKKKKKKKEKKQNFILKTDFEMKYNLNSILILNEIHFRNKNLLQKKLRLDGPPYSTKLILL